MASPEKLCGSVVFFVVLLLIGINGYFIYQFKLQNKQQQEAVQDREDIIRDEIETSTTSTTLAFEMNTRLLPDCASDYGVGDGHCDDNFNNKACSFDLGDCCLPIIDVTFCKACFCEADKSQHIPALGPQPFDDSKFRYYGITSIVQLFCYNVEIP